MYRAYVNRGGLPAMLLFAGLAVTAACGESDGNPTSPSASPSTLQGGGSLETGGGNNGGGDGGEGEGAGGFGRLSISITDSPFQDALAVLVAIDKVEVHRAGGGWETVMEDPITCDLKQLEGPSDILGEETLEAGRYTQIRLHVAGGSIHFDNTASTGPCAAVIVPPAGLTGTLQVRNGTVKLNRTFVLADGGTTSLLLDFDGDRSIRQDGGNGGGNNPGCGNGNGNGNPNCDDGEEEEEDPDAGSFTLNPVIAVESVDEEE